MLRRDRAVETAARLGRPLTMFWRYRETAIRAGLHERIIIGTLTASGHLDDIPSVP